MVVKKQLGRRPFVGGVVLALVSALGLSACGGEAPAAPPAPIPEVEVVVVKPQTLTLATELPGRTRPYRVAEVRPQVSGLLRQRNFQEGADVKAGEHLYEIEPAPYQAVLAREQASLVAAQKLVKRYEPLAKVHAISQQQFDDAQAAYLQAKARVDSAKIDLAYTRINAPIAGRIGRSKMTQGALVTANQPEALATVQQIDPIYVDIVQPSVSLLQLREDWASGRLKSAAVGQAEVRLRLENGQTYRHPGQLQFAEVSVEPGTAAVTLRAEFPNPDGVLLPGMFVRAQLQEGVRENVLLVPQQGVSRDSQGQAMVLLMDEHDIVQQRLVRTGRTLDGHWVVEQGLQEGDRVVVAGVQHVRPGVKARIAAAKDANRASRTDVVQ